MPTAAGVILLSVLPTADAGNGRRQAFAPGGSRTISPSTEKQSTEESEVTRPHRQETARGARSQGIAYTLYPRALRSHALASTLGRWDRFLSPFCRHEASHQRVTGNCRTPSGRGLGVPTSRA